MSLLLGPHFSRILTDAITRYPCCVVPCSPRFPATCFLVSQPRPKNNKALRHCASLPTHHAANIFDCLNTNLDGILLHYLTFVYIFMFNTFAIANNYPHRSPPKHQPLQVSAVPSRDQCPHHPVATRQHHQHVEKPTCTSRPTSQR